MENQNKPKKFKSFFDNNYTAPTTMELPEGFKQQLRKELDLLTKRVKVLEDNLKKVKLLKGGV